tara:strand:- start:859 stop:3312 length:2454 start_codon:yes stop_codon:yes gene_type:complete
MNLNELPDMSDALKKVQQYNEKKLDPVGQEDDDVNNDGKVDSSDSYLKNRRKTVKKAIAKESVEGLDETVLPGSQGSAAGRTYDSKKDFKQAYKSDPSAFKSALPGRMGMTGGGRPGQYAPGSPQAMGRALPVGIQKSMFNSGLGQKLSGGSGFWKSTMKANNVKIDKKSAGGKVKKEELIHELSQLSEEQLQEILGGLHKAYMSAGPKTQSAVKNYVSKNAGGQSSALSNKMTGNYGGGGGSTMASVSSADAKKAGPIIKNALGKSKGGKVKKEEFIHDLSQLSEEQFEEIYESLFNAAKSALSGTKIGGRISNAYNAAPKKAQGALTQVGQSVASGLTGGSSRNMRGGAGGGLGINKIARDNNISGSEMKKAGPAVKSFMTKGVSGGLSSLGFSKGGKVKTRKEAFEYLDDNVDAILEWFDAEGVDVEALTEEQLQEILGGLAGGLMNMGKKGGFMKGATTGIGGLAGKAMGNSLLGFSKGGKVKKKMKKEAFAFSEEEEALLEEHGAEIDELTDEQLIDFFVEAIEDLATDEEDLFEICEALEEVELLDEASDKYYDSAVKASKDAAKRQRPSRVERMKNAAKKAAVAVKAGVKGAAKKAIGAGARAAGHAKGEFEAARIKSKRAAMSRPEKKEKDDDGTGGKLDALLKDTRGTSSSSDSSGGGGERDAGSEARGRLKSKKKGPGLLRRLGSAVKSGLKKAVGKTARAVSSGSDKLAKRMNEDYDKIAHLHESGLFSIEEIENVIEEGYKPIDKKKENKMYRRAGNLSREALSKGMSTKEGSKAQDKSGKIVSAISRQKEKERFDKMVDHDARK